jgi:glycosyltransferase involved in cell wall biosynthesis
VLVGKRGWLYDEVLAALNRSRALREHVLQFGAASDTVQHWLLSNALGALVPSHDEGYGLPLVEALALGLPALASDIPVFREISQGCATYCNAHAPLDWLRMVSSLHDRSSAAWQNAAHRARAFRRPTVAAFTSAITAFLESL